MVVFKVFPTLNYSLNTVKAVRTAMTQWKEFQKACKKEFDFNLPHLADQNINEYIKMVDKYSFFD